MVSSPKTRRRVGISQRASDFWAHGRGRRRPAGVRARQAGAQLLAISLTLAAGRQWTCVGGASVRVFDEAASERHGTRVLALFAETLGG